MLSCLTLAHLEHYEFYFIHDLQMYIGSIWKVMKGNNAASFDFCNENKWQGFVQIF